MWDCDIETMGLVTGSQFTNNQLNNAVSCGIGGWWWSSWRSNVVRNNRVDSSANLMSLYRLGGLDTSRGETTVYFDHNTFDSNGLSHPTGQYGGVIDLTTAGNPALVGVPVVLGANLVDEQRLVGVGVPADPRPRGHVHRRRREPLQRVDRREDPDRPLQLGERSAAIENVEHLTCRPGARHAGP